MTTYCDQSKKGPSQIQPKRKKNNFFPKNYPFPIFKGESENAPWNCIIGHIKEQCVEVSDEENIRLLFTMGIYGKGTLSRSTPQALEKSLRREHKKSFKGKKSNCSAELKKKEILHDGTDSEDGSEKKENPARKRRKYEIEVVLSDTTSSDSAGNASDSSDRISVTSKKDDEVLQLSFEEAYFLSYGLGVLVVKDKDQPLDLMRLWHKFCELHPCQNFPIMYTAYHHFRSKGWVVRSGAKYGVDFALYKDGPPFYHSSYAVIVKPVKEQNLRDIATGSRPNLTWSSLAGLNRLCTHVSKALLILYVIKPGTISENKISTPFCVSQYKLEEVIVNRWVPSSDRSSEENTLNAAS